MYLSAAWAESSIPALTASALQGIQITPAEYAVVPPNTGSFSATMTFRP